MNQSDFLAITCKFIKAWEISPAQVAVGFGFAVHWQLQQRNNCFPQSFENCYTLKLSYCLNLQINTICALNFNQRHFEDGPSYPGICPGKKNILSLGFSFYNISSQSLVQASQDVTKSLLSKITRTLKTPHPEKVIFIVIVISIIIICIIIIYYYDCFINSQPPVTRFSMSTERSCTNVVFKTEFNKTFNCNPELFKLLEFIAIQENNASGLFYGGRTFHARTNSILAFTTQVLK